MSPDELKSKLEDSNKRKFNIRWTSETDFVISSMWSVGTFQIDHSAGILDGIKAYGRLEHDPSNGKTSLYISTKLRFEVVFTLILIGFIFIVAVATDKFIPLWLCLLLLFVPFWFWFVYRVQEKALFKRFTEFISSKT